jgi:microcompartment protein CcmK/EutM
MRICEIIGTVTLNRWHPSVAGARFKIAVPLSWANLSGSSAAPAEELIVYDDLGAALGHRVAVSEGREAAQPFYPNEKPIDAASGAILDTVHLSL